MKAFIRVMKALSDPSRVRMLKLLSQRELCVCEIQELIGLAQSTVSKHLKILEEAGLIEFRKEGAWIIYRITSTPDSPYAAVMLNELPDWLGEDQHLVAMLEKLPEVDRAWILPKK